MKRLVTVMLGFMLTSALWAQSIVVAYVDGTLEINAGSRWDELFIGDGLTEASEIRLGAASYAELSSGTTTVKLSRAGTYRVGDLIVGAGRTQSIGLGGVVLNRINRMTGAQANPTQTTAGGARASEAVTQTGPVWAGGESVSELIADALELLGDGAFLDAYYLFEEAHDFAISDYDHALASFYYGYASSLVGRNGQALELLTAVGPDPDTDYYSQHLIALGQLLVESFSYQDAVDQLRPLAEDAEAAPEDRQSAELLIGVAYDALGSDALARSFLLRARTRVPGTPAAQIAADLLN